MAHDKTVRILTLRNFKNYGNRLQNYALSAIIRQLGYRVRTVNCFSAKQFLYNLTIRWFPLGENRAKEYRLYRFTRKRIRQDYLWYRSADYVVIGSDQVWNPKYLEKQPVFLNVPYRGVKIAYAASVGFDKLSDAQEKMFSKHLNDFESISVREKGAKPLLQPLTNRKIDVVLDPTLLLPVSDYEKLEECPKNIGHKDKYVVSYILGDYKYRKMVEDFAKKHNYKTIYLSDGRESDYSVEEFLYLIHHAQAVFTDSFHACVFSFLFERPFLVFKRSGEANYMYTRIQNLLELFNLKGHEFSEKIPDSILQTNYSSSKNKLDTERKKSTDILRGALNG